MKKLIKFIVIFIFIFYFQNSFSEENRINLIQDVEIENFLKDISKPILKSANLNPKDVKFFIVDDASINAFVAGGQNIFINTGTLVSFEDPDAVLGIISHEVGHISEGHIARSNEVYSKMSNIGIGSIFLGIGTLLAGVPEVSQAIIMGGLQIQQQTALKYTRGQEESADALAIKYLNENNMSGEALLSSMNEFYIEQLSYQDYQEYYSTHPLVRNRKQYIENKIKSEKGLLNAKFNNQYHDSFNFIKAKILAYQYDKSKNGIVRIQKNSDYEKYSQSIIDMNKGNIESALSNCDYLISKYKNNPYFYELRGDIYLKNNNPKEALINYENSDKIIGDNLLIKKMISYIIIKYNQELKYNNAIEKLNFIVQEDNEDNSALKLLAEVYYKNNELSMSYLNLAKYYKNLKNNKQTKKYLELAKKNTKNSKILIQIEDTH